MLSCGFQSSLWIFFSQLNHKAHRILAPWPGIEPVLLVVKAWILNHCTTRKIPLSDLKKLTYLAMFILSCQIHFMYSGLCFLPLFIFIPFSLSGLIWVYTHLPPPWDGIHVSQGHWRCWPAQSSCSACELYWMCSVSIKAMGFRERIIKPLIIRSLTRREGDSCCLTPILENAWYHCPMPALLFPKFSSFLKFIFFNWSIVDLQWCVNFCCIAKWLGYTHIHVLKIFFSSMVYPRILNILPCAVQ